MGRPAVGRGVDAGATGTGGRVGTGVAWTVCGIACTGMTGTGRTGGAAAAPAAGTAVGSGAGAGAGGSPTSTPCTPRAARGAGARTAGCGAGGRARWAAPTVYPAAGLTGFLGPAAAGETACRSSAGAARTSGSVGPCAAACAAAGGRCSLAPGPAAGAPAAISAAPAGASTAATGAPPGCTSGRVLGAAAATACPSCTTCGRVFRAAASCAAAAAAACPPFLPGSETGFPAALGLCAGASGPEAGSAATEAGCGAGAGTGLGAGAPNPIIRVSGHASARPRPWRDSTRELALKDAVPWQRTRAPLPACAPCRTGLRSLWSALACCRLRAPANQLEGSLSVLPALQSHSVKL